MRKRACSEDLGILQHRRPGSTAPFLFLLLAFAWGGASWPARYSVPGCEHCVDPCQEAKQERSHQEIPERPRRWSPQRRPRRSARIMRIIATSDVISAKDAGIYFVSRLDPINGYMVSLPQQPTSFTRGCVGALLRLCEVPAIRHLNAELLSCPSDAPVALFRVSGGLSFARPALPDIDRGKPTKAGGRMVTPGKNGKGNVCSSRPPLSGPSGCRHDGIGCISPPRWCNI